MFMDKVLNSFPLVPFLALKLQYIDMVCLLRKKIVLKIVSLHDFCITRNAYMIFVATYL